MADSLNPLKNTAPIPIIAAKRYPSGTPGHATAASGAAIFKIIGWALVVSAHASLSFR